MKTKRQLHDRATEIITRAAAENRAMTTAERTEVEELHAEIERHASAPQPTRAGGRQRENDIGGDPSLDGSNVTEHVTELRSDQRCADWISARRPLSPEHRDLDIGRFLRGMFVPGKRTEAEQRALSEGVDSAGGVTVPDYLSAQLIDLARAQSVVFQSGARTIPLESDKHTVARVASDPTPAWRAEGGAVAESDPSFDSVVFAPKSLAVITRVSQELLQDSQNIEQELPRVLSAAMAGELDRVALLGSGAGNEPTGIDNQSGVLEVMHNAGITNYTPFLSARRRLLQESADPSRINNWIMSPDADADISDLKDTTNQPLQVPPALDRPRSFTPQVTSKLTDITGSNETTIFGGDFGQLAVGMRLSIQIRVLTEIFSETLEVGFLSYLRADIAAIQPKHLVRITGVTTS